MVMKLKIMTLLLAAVMMFGCKVESKPKTQTNENTVEVVAADTVVVSAHEVSEPPSESSNDIRFENFKTNVDWLDNEYIQALRAYLDDCAEGVVDEPCLVDYPTFAKGKIAIMQTEPFLMGGLFVYFFFVEDPNWVFNANVYSDVDESTRTVSGYRVLSMSKGDMETGLTKEEVLKIANTTPENQLW